MLILTRGEFEEIIIGDNAVRITVLAIGNNQIKLGFTAAKDISIHRSEIYHRIEQEKEQEKENRISDYA